MHSKTTIAQHSAVSASHACTTQPAAGGAVQPAAVQSEGASAEGDNIHLDQKRLLLQLKRNHYDAIKSRRKLWEARPLVDSTGRPSIHNKLATVGRAVVLQSGADTNDRVRIAEVRRYTPCEREPPLQQMVVDLGARLLPDVPADTTARMQVYEALYGVERCSCGFVAVRLEWPNEGCSCVAQPAAAKQFPSQAGRVLNTEGSAELKSEENRKRRRITVKSPNAPEASSKIRRSEAGPSHEIRGGSPERHINDG